MEKQSQSTSIDLLPFCSQIPQNLRQSYSKLFINQELSQSKEQNPVNKDLSFLHVEQAILVNAKCQQWTVSNIVENQYISKLKETNKKQYFEVKSQVFSVFYKLVKAFELNSKFLCGTSIKIFQFNKQQKISQLNHQQQLQQLQQLQQQHQQKSFPFITYLIRQIYETFQEVNQNEPQSQKYREHLSNLYFQILKFNNVPLSQLRTITQKLTDFYYTGALFRFFVSTTDTEEEQQAKRSQYLKKAQQKLLRLSPQLIQTSFRLLQAGIQERLIQPFLYFIGRNGIPASQLGKQFKSNDAIRLIFHSPKWIFSKGLTLWIWLNSQAKIEKNSQQSNKGYQGYSIFMLKTDQNHVIQIRLLRNYDMQIIIANGSGGKKDSNQKYLIPQKDHKISPNQLTLIGIQLDSQETSTGFFGKSSTIYSLKIKANNHSVSTPLLPPSSTLPKFSSNDLITQFSLCQGLIGCVYSIIVSNRAEINSAHDKLSPTCAYSNPLYSSYYGPCNQRYVWDLINSDILKKESIVAIFNAERTVEGGVLVNYVGQKNVGCFSGQVSKEKYNRYDFQITDVLMPYLYFLVVQKFQSEKIKNENNKSSEFPLFDMILKQIISITSTNNQSQIISPSSNTTSDLNEITAEIDSQTGPTDNPNLLFILYFLELSEYPISQSTLDYLIEQFMNGNNEHEKSGNVKSYFNLIGKYINVPLLLQKGLKLSITNQNMALQQHFQGYDINPVQKIQLLFYLQTKWQQKWNQYQGFNEWWSPSDFVTNMQKDKEFVQDDYIYQNQNPQNFKGSKFQWEVRNFVSNDFCKCIIKPVFDIPVQCESLLCKYQQEYIKKQCMLQSFKLQLKFPQSSGTVKITKYQKSGTLGRMKRKLMGQKKQDQITPNKKKLHKLRKSSIVLKDQFQTECLSIDLLSVVMCHISVTPNGFIILSSQHTSKQFDHMCVKAYKNQQFLYTCFHLKQIKYIRKRRFNQCNRTVEIRRKNGQIHLLHFYNKNVDQFISLLSDVIQVRKDPYSYYLDSRQPERWIQKRMSNFQYILWLNDVAGRNFLDIAQYPVMPWVYIADEANEKQIQKQFRNLVKNMGSQGTEQRISHFLQKYSSNNEQQLFNQYHFGTHYSSSAIIFNYLIRVRPFSTGAITLQSGKFDCADRVFWSYVGSWQNATNSPTDIRELVPQVYSLPQMFINVNRYDFGQTQDKLRIDNVEIPKWAKKNPYRFIVELRKKIESSYTSENVNNWIDLIFGYKQRGQEAINNMNIFFPLTYQDAINLDNIDDEQEKISFETQIAHFGQNPAQVIGNNPHPIRMKINQSWEGKLVADGGAGIKIQRCNLDSKSTVNSKPISTQKFLYKSVFQAHKAIMSIKFLNQQQFIVIKKNQYQVFQIIKKKNDFISKEQDVPYEIQTTEISLNYKEISSSSKHLPTAVIGSNIVAIGGFYNSYIHFFFIDEPKCNQAVKFSSSNLSKTMSSSTTITAIEYSQIYNMFYLGDNQGYLKVYELTTMLPLNTSTKEIEFSEVSYAKIHDKRINQISLSDGKASMYLTCSDDGHIKAFNAFTNEIMRVYSNPFKIENGTGPSPISFCQLSVSPLYSVVFFSEANHTLYSYSINGQYLEHRCIAHSPVVSQQELKDKGTSPATTTTKSSVSLHGMFAMPSSDNTQKLVYLTCSRQVHIVDLPFLELIRKIKLKKTDAEGKPINTSITCFSACSSNGKMCLIGTQQGGVQIIADPQSY